MDNSWKKLRLCAALLSICIMLLGIVMVVWPRISALTVCIILGFFCIGIGIVDIIRYFKLGLTGIFFRYDLILSICSILLGLLMLLRSSAAMAFLPIAVGIYMIIGSVLCIQLAVELYRFHSGAWLIAMLCGIAGSVLSFLLLLDPFSGAQVLMVVTGISLIVSGIQDLYLLVSISKAIGDGKKKGESIEAEFKSAE